MCYDTEQCDVWISKEPKARKPHKCHECGRTIPKGQRYVYTAGIFDGGPFTHKECWRCSVLLKKVVEIETAAGCTGIEAVPGMGRLTDAANELGLFPRNNSRQ